MLNIKFNYMYRDGANYKNHGEAIFSNSDNVDLAEAEKIIRSKLIDGENFYVDQFGLKDLHFDTWDKEIDHTWHEFVELEWTDVPATGVRTFRQFLEEMAGQK